MVYHVFPESLMVHTWTTLNAWAADTRLYLKRVGQLPEA